MNRENPRDGRSRRHGGGIGGKPQPLCKGIGKVVVVEGAQVAYAEAGARAVEINFDGIVPHRNHPKHVASVNMHVVVVNLLKQAGRSNRTGIDVKSNKGERASVLLAVRAPWV